jgi:hypothetical protein
MTLISTVDKEGTVNEILLTSDRGWMKITERNFTYFRLPIFIFSNLHAAADRSQFNRQPKSELHVHRSLSTVE